MQEPDVLNIPAYQRKRSIAARARKKPDYLSPIKPIKKTGSKISRRSKKTESFTNPFISDIPAKTSLPSQELFPNPFEQRPHNNTAIREWTLIGTCEGYFDKIDVAIIKLISPLRLGDTILFERQNGLFEQAVNSMQIDRRDVRLAPTGSDIGLKVSLAPRVGAAVYKLNK
ncbi:hypothetical protein HY605_00520 [Candidatus Peregrinibacteria bacterium]|nr:hypothetical protein [Candidatus Peregrinibacteria bacterium]